MTGLKAGLLRERGTERERGGEGRVRGKRGGRIQHDRSRSGVAERWGREGERDGEREGEREGRERG